MFTEVCKDFWLFQVKAFRSPGKDFLSSRKILICRIAFARRNLVCSKYRVRILVLIDKSRSYILAFGVWNCGEVPFLKSRRVFEFNILENVIGECDEAPVAKSALWD